MAALTSAVPTLYPHRVLLGVGMVALIGVANLRGLRESGRIFAVWSYLFIAGYLALIGYGLVSYLLGGPGAPPPARLPAEEHIGEIGCSSSCARSPPEPSPSPESRRCRTG